MKKLLLAAILGFMLIFAQTGLADDKIIEGNTSVEVVDVGDGRIVFTEDGTEVGRFAGNKLGINTTTPGSKLEVQGGVAFGNAIHNSVTRGHLTVVGGSSPDLIRLYDDNELTVPRFLVQRAGNIGIGTTTPHLNLDIKSTVPGIGLIESDQAANNQVWDYLVQNGQYRMRAVNDARNDAANWLTVDRTDLIIDKIVFGHGKIGIGTAIPNEKLTIDGVLSLDETVAPSATNGYGKFYVKASDGLAYFKDSGNTEYGLTSGGGCGGSALAVLKASELNDTSDPHLLIASELKNTILTNVESIGADEWDFPAQTEGWNFIFIKEANQNITLDPYSNENWYVRINDLAYVLNGAGRSIVNTTNGRSTVTCFSTESAVYCTGDSGWETGL